MSDARDEAQAIPIIRFRRSFSPTDFELALGEVADTPESHIECATNIGRQDGSLMRTLQATATWAHSSPARSRVARTFMNPAISPPDAAVDMEANPQFAFIAGLANEVLAADGVTSLVRVLRSATDILARAGRGAGRSRGSYMMLVAAAGGIGLGKPLYADKGAEYQGYRPQDAETLLHEMGAFTRSTKYKFGLEDLGSYFPEVSDAQAPQGLREHSDSLEQPDDGLTWLRDILFESLSNAHLHGTDRMVRGPIPRRHLAVECRIGTPRELRDPALDHYRDNFAAVPVLALSVLDTGVGIAAHHRKAVERLSSASEDFARFSDYDVEIAYLSRALRSRFKAETVGSGYGLGMRRIIGALGHVGGTISLRTGTVATKRDFRADPLQPGELSVESLDPLPLVLPPNTQVPARRPYARGTRIDFVIPLITQRPEVM